jgi:hypothetical protein
MALKKKENLKDMAGVVLIIFKSVLQATKLHSKIKKSSEEKNGIIWYLMKPNILKISSLKDGKFY